jgi:DNA-binding NtrC family response regulator
MGVVVVISSDAPLQVEWKNALEGKRHTVLLATTCAAGAKRLHEGGVDLVLADYEVAGGLGHLTKALERLPDPPPLMLVSSAPDAPSVSARLGAAAFLTKPCAPGELTDLVARCLDGRGSVPRQVDEAPTRPNQRR